MPQPQNAPQPCTGDVDDLIFEDCEYCESQR